MRVYEILFVIAPNVEESGIESLIAQFSEVIANQGGRVTRVDRMGRRQLAYPIRKFNEGYYVVLTMEGTGKEIAEVERRMRVTDSVIRYLTVRIDEDLKRAEKLRARRAARAAAASARKSGTAVPAIEEQIAAVEEEEE
jgi:small subunit ribosomal protein S6